MRNKSSRPRTKSRGIRPQEPYGPQLSRLLLRARHRRPRRCHAAEQRDELAASYVGHGLLLALWRRPMRSVYHTPSLPRTGRQVLGQHLKCSELDQGWAAVTSRRGGEGLLERGRVAGWANPWRLPGGPAV